MCKAEVEFQYNGNIYVIQCTEDQKLIEICNNFIFKTNIKQNEIYYLYDGKIISESNTNLKFNEIANLIDKNRTKMNILVMDINNNSKVLYKSKYVICPGCGGNIKIKINDYKIDLYGCKNNHKLEKIKLNEFENTQMINLINIKCGLCKNNNKSNTYKNKMYKCYECNTNLCPLCKDKHDKKHNIYNYDKINFICMKHNDPYTNYCKTCKMNICILCNKEHINHKVIPLIDMMKDKNDLIIKLEEFRKEVNIFNNNINEIIEILNLVKENIYNYYKIEEFIINNYEQNKRNYEILYNINQIINSPIIN